MRLRQLTRGVAILLAVPCLFALSVGASEAAPECLQVDLITGICIISIDVPAAPPSAEDISDERGPADPGPDLPCWQDPSSYTRLDPQPAAGDPLWQGRDPADGGAIYHCHIPDPESLISNIFIWLAEPPAAVTPVPSPRELAQTAVDSMGLEAIEIGIVPEPGAGSLGLVGMPVWMWAAEPGPSTVGPISASASAGGITVTATARVSAITWDMGDGNTVVCHGAGTAYHPSFGRQQSPDCGHVYTTSSAGEPGDRFTVTATSDWVITWEGAGQSGTIRMDGLSQSVQVAVGEAQVLVTS